jgi:hypothetical protein
MHKESLTTEELAQIWFFKTFAAEFGVELLDSFLTLYSKLEAKYSKQFAGATDPRNLIDSRLLNHAKPWLRPIDINDPAPHLH